MYCICKSKGKTTAGFSRIDGDLWGCGKCGKPTKMVFERLTHMLAPRGATALLSEFGRRDGIHELKWATTGGDKTTLVYIPYPRKVDMADGPALLNETWALLDSHIDRLMASKKKSDAEADMLVPVYQAKARAVAEVLAVLMSQFYPDADAVAREAMKRYKARQANGDSHETPGLAESIWNPNTRWDGTPYSEGAERKARPTPTAKLTAEQEAGIKNALSSGAFTPEQLADMFKVPVSAVKALA